MLRAGSAVASQVISSATNFLAMAAVAHGSSAELFGIWSILYATMIFVVSIARGTIGTALVLRARDLDGDIAPHQAFTLATPLLGAQLVICVAISLVSVASPVLTILFFGASVGGLLEDVSRYVAFSRGRPGLALVGDTLWFLTMAAPLALLAASESLNAITASLSWGAGAWVGALGLAIGLRSHGSGLPTLRQLYRSLAGDLRVLLGESLTQGTSVLLVPFIAAATASPAVAGALRGGLTLFGPQAAVAAGLVPLGLRAFSARARPHQGYPPGLILWVLAVGGFTASYSAAVVFLISPFGTAILGETWLLTEQIVAPIALAAVLDAIAIGLQMQLRIAGRLVDLRTLTIVVAATSLPAFAVAGAAWGLRGVGWAWALRSVLLVVASAFAYVTNIRRGDS